MAKLNTTIRKKSPLKHPLVELGVPVLIAAILIAVAAKPSYRFFKEWRIDSNAKEAAEAFDRGNFSEARRLAMAVLNLRKGDYQMLKLMQLSMTELNDPKALDLAITLMQHPDGSEEDRLLGFSSVCEELPLSTVSRIWMSLGEETALKPAYLTPFVARLIDQNQFKEAYELLSPRSDQYLEPELRFQYVRMLMKSKKSAYLDRGQLAISDIIFSEEDSRLEAFRLLSAIPPEDFHSGSFSDLEEWVAQQEGATIDDHLLAKIQELQRHPERKSEIIEAGINKYREEDPAAVARWLLQLNRFEDVLTLLPAETSKDDHEFFRSRAQALLRSERWQEAYEWLADAPEHFPALELHCMRIQGPDNIDGPNPRRPEWELALREAEADRNGFLELHQRMSAAGKPDLANEALAEAVARNRGRLPFWVEVQHLIPWLRKEQKSALLNDVCSVMATLEPANPEPTIESLDIGGVLGKTSPDAIIKVLGSIEESYPKIRQSIRFRETLATALLLQNQPAEAIAALSEVSGPESSRLRIKAITAAAKAMLGDKAASDSLLETIDWKMMLTEEKDLFKAMIATAEKEAEEKAKQD